MNDRFHIITTTLTFDRPYLGPPAATFNAPNTVNEGSPINLSLTNPVNVDPATLEYAFDCGSGYGPWDPSSTTSCPTTDNGHVTVHGKLRDQDGESSDYSADVTILNVAPTATFTATPSVAEGSPITLALTNPADPSSVDTAAGFRYAFDCGDGAGYGSFGSSASVSCPTNDNGTRTVRGQVRDKDGGVREYTASVTIVNVAPTATFTATSPVAEGSPITLALTNPADPSSVDTAAGFRYAFDCGDSAGYGSFGSSASANCPTNDNGTRTVRGQVRDKDGGVREYTASVTITNVAPTATFSATSPVAEGSPIQLAFSNPQDVAADLPTLQYAFDCGGGYGSFGSSPRASCPTSDNGTRTIRGQVRDKDGGVSEYTASVTITNVAPTATFTAPPSVAEGSPITLALTNPSDPSSVDTAAGFSYAFDCGDGAGYSSFSSSASASCPTNDNGTRTVRGQVRDKDGGVSEYTATVVIVNVAPTATFTATSPVAEGSAITLALTNPNDPSSADMAAGFSYAFDCGDGAGYSSFSSSASASCPTSDNGVRIVGGRVRDKDNGTREYTATVGIVNVAPSVSAPRVIPASANEGDAVSASAGFSDPGANDAPFTCAVGYGDGSGGQAGTISGSVCTGPSHTYADDGTYTITISVTDKDGAVGTNASSYRVANVAPTLTLSGAPDVAEGTPYLLQLNATDPGADTISSWMIDWGDGPVQFVSGNPATLNHTYDDGPTPYAITATATDEDGTYNANPLLIMVTNVVPSATFSAPLALDEGSAITLTLTNPSDPSRADTTAGFRYAFDCGDGAGYRAPSAIPTASCSALDNPSQTVRGRIIDKDGGANDYVHVITIRNLPPQVSAISGPAAVALNATAGFSATFTDPGVLDTHTAVWEWGDGTTTQGTITEAGGSGSVAGSHAYAQTGVYTITLTVTDKDGGQTSVRQSIAVYSRSSSVKGIDHFDGPAAGSLFTGRVFFKLNVSYNPGNTTPTGQTNLSDKDTDFTATSYDWLVVNAAGDQAQYQGTGTINGTGTYTFLVTATQATGGGQDNLHIQIWDTTGTLIYDNSPYTVVQRGTVVIRP